MNKFFLQFIFLFLLYTLSVSASQSEVKFYLVIPGASTITVDLISGGGGFSLTPNLYDVTVILTKDSYGQGEKVTAVIVIRNSASSVKDISLTYYLNDKKNNTFSRFDNINVKTPPTYYDKNNCKDHGGIIDEKDKCIIMIEKDMFLPVNALIGEWNLNVEYPLRTDTTVTIHKNFSVFERTGIQIGERLKLMDVMILILLLVAMIYFTNNMFNKKKNKKLKKVI